MHFSNYKRATGQTLELHISLSLTRGQRTTITRRILAAFRRKHKHIIVLHCFFTEGELDSGADPENCFGRGTLDLSRQRQRSETPKVLRGRCLGRRFTPAQAE